MREKFEDWATKLAEFNLERGDGGHYKDTVTRAAWQGYMAGCGDAADFWKEELMGAIDKWVKLTV